MEKQNGQNYYEHCCYRIPDVSEKSTPCPAASGWCWLHWDYRTRPPHLPGLDTCPWVDGTWSAENGGDVVNFDTLSFPVRSCCFAQAVQHYPERIQVKQQATVLVHTDKLKQFIISRLTSCTSPNTQIQRELFRGKVHYIMCLWIIHLPKLSGSEDNE